MKNKLKSLILILSILVVSTTGSTLIAETDKPAYRLFFKGGTPARYADLVNRASHADVILFGELHDSHIAHWLQLELAKDILKRKKSLIFGAEMFERDNQLIIDEYLKGYFSRHRFETEVKLWPNYKSDYRPLIELAKKQGLRFIATNVPRRYASMVFRKGLASLTRVDHRGKRFLPALPILFDPELPGYRNMAARLKNHGHHSAFLAEAQALKDAAMADAIMKNRVKGTPFLHINGTYHSDNREGIYWYLKKADKDLIIVTISTVEQKSISRLEKKALKRSDFLLIVPFGAQGTR